MAVATAAIAGGGTLGMTRLAAQQRIGEAELLGFEPMGNLSLVHITDIHAQIKPLYFREPSVNLGVGEARGLPPHITGQAFLKAYGIEPVRRMPTRFPARISPRSRKPTARSEGSTASPRC